MKTQKALLILAAVLAGTTVYADKVKLSDTPAPVKKAIQRRAGQQVVEDIDRDVRNGQTTYEASWKDAQGVQQEFLVAENGQVLRDVTGANKHQNKGFHGAQANVTSDLSGFTNGQQAPMNWASETVQNKLRGMAGRSHVENFKKGQFNGQTAFEGSFKTNGNTMTVILSEDGTLLAQSPSNIAATTTTTTTAPATGSIAGFTDAQQAPMNWASDTVQNKFKQISNGAAIQNFQKGKFNGQTAYLGTYSQNGQTTTIVLGENGTVLTSVPNAVGAAPGSVSGTSK